MSSIPLLPSTNLAPLKPLYALADDTEPTPTYVTAGVIELLKDYLGRDKNIWDEIANTSEVTSNFIQGKQIWQPNYWNNTWSVRPVNLADPNRITSINLMQFYCTSQIKMITSSNPDLEPVDEYKQREYKEAVKIAKAVWNRYEQKFYTSWFNQQEALHAIISGTYIESVEYDLLAEGAKVFKEIFGEQEIEISPGYSKCYEPECGKDGGYAEFTQSEIPSCPNCGSYDITPPEAPISQKFQTVTGMQPIQLGDLTLKLKPIQACRFDLKFRPEESSWMIFRQQMDKRKLEHLLGDVMLPSASISTGNTLAGTSQNYRPDERNENCIIDRLSVKAEDLAHIIPTADEKTIDGTVIPKGKRLSDIAPEGGTFLILNESHIIGFYPGVHHSKEVSTGTYHMRLESGIGRGSEDTVEVQKRMNRLDSQNIRYMEASASPGRTYIEGAIDRQHVKRIGFPDANIPVRQEIALALGSTPVIQSLQPGSMAAQFFSYTYDILNQYRQLTSHSTDFTNAFPGVKNSTAHGAELAKANAESVFSPMLQVKAGVRVNTAHNTLALYKEHFKGVKQFFSFGETSTGQMMGDHIDGDDIDCDVKFTAVRDSEQPRTPYSRQIDFGNMMAVAGQAGGIEQLKANDPKLLQAMYDVFDIDIDDASYDVMADVCEDRLEDAFNLKKQYDALVQQATLSGQQLPATADHGRRG